MRTDLDVPYAEKDAARSAGAKWDSASKCWFVPDGVDPAPFAKWFAFETPQPEIALHNGSDLTGYRAPRYAIVSGFTACWKCKHDTPASALLLAEHEELDEEYGDYSDRKGPVLIVASHALDPSTVVTLREKASWMRPGHSKTRSQVYLAPHCRNCDALQGAYPLGLPGAIFFPLDAEQAARLTVEWIDDPIEVSGDGSMSTWHDWLMLDA
jgi:hypothetical protein